MNRLDVYYRALLLYKNQISENRLCVSDNHSVATADSRFDNIYFERKTCEIDNTWVEEIEKGLVFIEKAIKEERQFIRTNGEVVEIGKVKNISKSSVEHLAKHSNLITRVPKEEEDIIPDALYTVEKLSDFAVYENKFLYMLLCYLRDFITLRYNKILDISNTYNGSMSMKKTVRTEKNTLIYTVDLSETRKDDKYLEENNPAKETIDRISVLLKAVLAFLSTPLMEMVAKVPMIKPPVTKTNVLKKNNNFKGAMELYAFITSYEGDGFTVHTETKHISPFADHIAEEMASSVTLASFATYQHALGIANELKEAYLAEEQRRKDQAFQERLERLEGLAKKLKKREITAEEYILELEKVLKEYEKRFSDYNTVKGKLKKTEEALEQANLRINELLEREQALIAELDHANRELIVQKQKYIDDMEAKRIEHENEIAEIRAEHMREIEELNQRHAEEVERIISEYEAKIEELNQSHAEEVERIINEYETKIEELNAEHVQQIEQIKEEYTQEIERINTEHAEKVNALTEEYETRIANVIEEKDNIYKTDMAIKDSTIALLGDRITALDTENSQVRTNLDAANAENTMLQEKWRLAEAKLLSLKRSQNKLEADDVFIVEEKFDELERMYVVFKKFYGEEWKKAKKAIRSEFLWKILKKEKADMQAPTSVVDGGEQENVGIEAEDEKALESIDTEETVDVVEAVEPSEGASVEDHAPFEDITLAEDRTPAEEIHAEEPADGEAEQKEFAGEA